MNVSSFGIDIFASRVRVKEIVMDANLRVHGVPKFYVVSELNGI